MPFREGYINLARHLLGQSMGDETLDEARFRSIVSRAYYGVFNLAKEALEPIKIPEDRNVHEFVIFEFERRTDQTSRSVAGRLRTLRGMRNRADYGKNDLDWARTADFQLRRAEQIQSLLSSL